ncbi:MAG: HAMP domain-containing protein, partial [Cyanobacteria bacterium J06639_1]
MTTSKDAPQTSANGKSAADAAIADAKLTNGKNAPAPTPEVLKGSGNVGKVPAPSAKPKRDRAARKDWLFGTTIRGRLLRAVLPTLLIPLGLVSGLAIYDIRKTAQDGQLAQQKELALLLAEDFAAELKGTEKALEVLTVTPTIQNAARAGAQKAQADGLVQKADAELEQQFATTKLIAPNQALNDFLGQVAEIEGFAEVFFTDRNGYNVAYSRPTSDFVQDDEGWWDEGKNKGLFLDSPEFDESTGSVNVDIVQAIVEPGSGNFLGVMKAGLPIGSFAVVEALGAVAEEAGLSGTEVIQVVDTVTGIPISTISPEGVVDTQAAVGGESLVELTRLMLSEIRDPNFEVAQVVEDVRRKFPAIKKFNLAPFFDVSGERELVADFEFGDKEYAISAVPGTNWVAVASVDLAEFQGAGNDLLIQIGVVSGLLAVAATGLLLLFARQLARPVDSLALAAQKVAAGDLDVKASEQGTIET